AEALASLLKDFHGQVDSVPFITAGEAVLIERLSGRWTCRLNGAHVFNEKTNPPKAAGKCDFDGAELYQRDDDKPETVKNRIKVYFEQTAPLISYYREHGKLAEIDGTQSIDQVTEDLLVALQN
ncbi:MAG: adenylate kinase, partial [Chloroflexi bacterium]